MPREHYLYAGQAAHPDEIAMAAQQTHCRSIAYTYTEPTVFFEYTYHTARLAHEAGLANIYVSNGYMTREMLETIQPYLDAVNVDLKAFRDQTYRQYVGAGLQPVLDSLKEIKQRGIWLEVTTLLIPGINDDMAELKDTVEFIARELNTDTPWHISRFMPAYKMTDLPSTPVETLRRARELGLAEGLHYVYLGNVLESGSGDTLCPECGRVLIQRSGLGVRFNQIRNGGCPYCGAPIPGVGMEGKLLSAECYPRGSANE